MSDLQDHIDALRTIIVDMRNHGHDKDFDTESCMGAIELYISRMENENGD